MDLNKSSLDKIEENLLYSEENISISNLKKKIKNSNFGCLLIGPTDADKSSLLKLVIRILKQKTNKFNSVIEWNFPKLFNRTKKIKIFIIIQKNWK